VDNVSTSIADIDYVLIINNCGDGWKIVSYIPTSTVVKENSRVVVYITLVVCVLLIVSILATIVLFKRSSSKIDNTVYGLIQKADFDQLTNVLNKNAFYEHTENILGQCKLTDNYAFLMLDVDNFKGVNDTLGHIYGDKVLTNVGAILTKNFPMENLHIVGRLGGDEFAVFINVPNDVTDVYSYVESKCKAVCEDFSHNYSGDNHDYKISASIGVAMYPKHGKNFESLYNSADTALYHSKRHGKDTYTIYNSSLKGGEV
jgi:diguanylate cyclase (GGDEF)-like protein